MCRKSLIPAVCLLWLLVGSGCHQQSQTSQTGPAGALPELSPDTVFRVHWLGKRELAIEGGAFYFTRVWDLPETQQLQAYAFDRLTTAPWRLLKGESALQNAPAGALRPLMDNLAYEESYLEFRGNTNGSIEIALAIRLDQAASGGWQTNLTFVVQSLTGYPPQPNRGDLPGWTLSHPQAPARIDFARDGDWTLLGITTATENELMASLSHYVSASPDPFGSRQTNLWLQVDTDLNWLARALGEAKDTAGNLPWLTAAVSGDGGFVLTDCNLKFPTPCGDNLQPWLLPEQMLREPIVSFMAVRGLSSMFTRLPGWSDLPLGEIPDQLYAWAQPESAFQLYLAAPVSDGKARMESLSDHLLNRVNPWLKANGPEVNGQPCPLFHESPGPGVLWGDMPGLQPFARAVSGGETDFLMAGLLPPAPSQSQPGLQPALLDLLVNTTNLVCLGWENTAFRLGAWTPVLQTARAVTGHAPLPDESPSMAWLTTLQSRVNDTTTTAVRTGSQTIRVHRKSTLGLSAAELHLLVDWLESPSFPRGLHTFQAVSAQSPR